MKRTDTILSAAFALLLLAVIPAQAQNSPVRQGNITVQMNRLAQRGDSLYVNMDIATDGKNVASRKSADFTPILSSGDNACELPKISVMGRNNYKNYRRAQALMSHKEHASYDPHAPYAVVRDYKGGQRVNYALAVPYEPWMSSAQLTLRKEDCGCGRSRTTDTRLLANEVDLERVLVIERYDMKPALAYIRPAAEPVKERSVSSEAFLDFAVGKTTLNPGFGGNASELEKIIASFEDVKGDKDVTLRGVSLYGYASPEGPIALNKRLSEGRANALKKYLQARYDYPESFYTTYFGGEDWEGLQKLVEASQMQYRDEVLEIIADVPVEQNREARLMALRGGVPYKQMLRELFPKLRRVVFRADYEVRQFDVEEAREVVKTRPQNLSLNEMFLVSDTYEAGSQEYNDLFETAVRLFPDDPTANINAAVAALGRRDFVSADRYLGRVKVRSRIPEYDNAKGLLAALRDQDLDKAEGYFRAAQDAGLEAATRNMEELAKVCENLDQIKEAELMNKR